MHAGKASKGRGQRAKGGKFPAGRVEPAKPAEKGEEKCTLARRAKAEASVQKEAKSPRVEWKRPNRRRKGKKMHAGEASKGRSQRAKGGKIPAGRVEPAKPAEKGEEKCTPARRAKAGVSVQREVKSPPTESSRRRKGKKCTPARRATAGSQRAKVGKFPAGRQSSNICRGRTILFPTVPFVCREVDIIPENRRFYYFGSE